MRKKERGRDKKLKREKEKGGREEGDEMEMRSGLIPIGRPRMHVSQFYLPITSTSMRTRTHTHTHTTFLVTSDHADRQERSTP